MKRLITASASEIEKEYQTFCEAVAYDMRNDEDEVIDSVAKQTIEAIQRVEGKPNGFLSDFEKVVRDYFKERNMSLNYETLASDLAGYAIKQRD